MKRFLSFIVGLCIASAAYGQAGITIDKLQPGSALVGGERIPMWQGTNPARYTTLPAIKTYLFSQPTWGAAGGDLSGTYPNPVVKGLQGQAVSSATPTNNQCLVYIGSFPTGVWTPQTCAGGGGGVTSWNGRTGAVVPANADYSFSLISGALQCSQMPSFTGDVANSLCATTVNKVNGVAYGASPSVDTVPVITAANVATYTAITGCPAGYLQYNTSTHAFACGSLGTGVATALAVNVGSAGAFVVFNGAGGTPSSLTLTNATGLPIAGITGLGTGVASALAVATGTTGGFGVTIATGATAMGTSAIASGACATVVTVAASGVLTTDLVDATFNADPTATTGYIAPNMLTIIPYPTANNVNFKVCNNTASSITPAAVTLNWRVRR